MTEFLTENHLCIHIHFLTQRSPLAHCPTKRPVPEGVPYLDYTLDNQKRKLRMWSAVEGYLDKRILQQCSYSSKGQKASRFIPLSKLSIKTLFFLYNLPTLYIIAKIPD